MASAGSPAWIHASPAAREKPGASLAGRLWSRPAASRGFFAARYAAPSIARAGANAASPRIAFWNCTAACSACALPSRSTPLRNAATVWSPASNAAIAAAPAWPAFADFTAACTGAGRLRSVADHTGAIIAGLRRSSFTFGCTVAAIAVRNSPGAPADGMVIAVLASAALGGTTRNGLARAPFEAPPSVTCSRAR